MKKISLLASIIITAIAFTFNACTKEPVDNSGGGGNGGGGGGGGGGGTTTGQGMFWIASDLGCGTITVSCNGISKTITGYYGAGAPACGAASTATFDLSPGSYSYSANCTGKTWNGTIVISSGGCTKIELTSAGGGSTTGQALFWTASDLGCGNITVICNGISKTITGYFPGGAPACGSGGAVTFDLAPGTYAFTASCTGKTWSGNITVAAGGCSKFQLTSSGGGGGGPTTGQGIFWTKSDFGCGSINVTLNGVTRTISSYYASVPGCGASGCANYTLNPGTYAYTASCSGFTWSGTITITAGGCAHVEFI